MIKVKVIKQFTASLLAGIITVGALAADFSRTSENVNALEDNQMSVLLAGNDYAGLSLDETKNNISQKYVLSTASLFSMFVYDSFIATNADVEGRLAAGGNIYQETGNDTYQIGCGYDDYNIANHDGTAHFIAQGSQAGDIYKSFAYVTGHKPWESKHNDSDWFGNYLHPKTAVFASDTEVWINNHGLLDSAAVQYGDADNNGNWLPYNVIDNSQILRLGEGQKLLDFDSEFEELRRRSEFISELNTAGTTISYGEDSIVFSYNSTHSPSVIYFTVDPEKAVAVTDADLYFDVPMNAKIIINVSGTSPKTTASYQSYFRNAGGEYERFKNNDDQTKNYLFNFYEAEELLISNSVYGSVLAPKAKVTGWNGHVSGGVTAYSFYGSTEIGHTPFIADSSLIPGLTNGFVAGALKVNEDGRSLAGAELSLYHADPSDYSLTGDPLETWISQGVSHILPVEYEGEDETRWYGIKETKAPPGYEITKEPVIFSVTKQTSAAQSSDLPAEAALTRHTLTQTDRNGGSFYYQNNNLSFKNSDVKTVGFTFHDNNFASMKGFIGCNALDGSGWMGWEFDTSLRKAVIDISGKSDLRKFDFNNFEIQIWQYTNKKGELFYDYESISKALLDDVYLEYDNSQDDEADLTPENPPENTPDVPEYHPIEKTVEEVYTIRAIDSSVLGVSTVTTHYYLDGTVTKEYSGSQAVINVVNKMLPADISLEKKAQSIGSVSQETSDENWVYLDRTDNADGDYIIDLSSYEQLVSRIEITAKDFNQEFAADIYFNAGKCQQVKIANFSSNTMIVTGGWWNQPAPNEIITIRTKELWWGYNGVGEIDSVRIILSDDTQIISTQENTQTDFVFTEDEAASASGEYTDDNNAVLYKVTVSGNNLASHTVTDVLPSGLKFLKLISPKDKLTYTVEGSTVEFKFNFDIDAAYTTYEIIYLCQIQDTSAARYVNHVYADGKDANAEIKKKTYTAGLEIIKKYIDTDLSESAANPYETVVIKITGVSAQGEESSYNAVLTADENGVFNSLTLELTAGYTYRISEVYSTSGTLYSIKSTAGSVSDGVLILVPQENGDYSCEFINRKSENKVYTDKAENKLFIG